MHEEQLVNAEYDENSIDGFEYAERVRKRPAVMLGSSGLSGAKHCFTEIYGNALDEAGAGYGDKLEVSRYKDGSLSVRDYGRGVPLGWNEKKGMYNWHLVYNELYMGGKTKSTQEQLRKVTDWSKFNAKSINYLFAIGLNGLGATATQYTSEFMTVKSYRDGYCTEMHYLGGYPVVAGEPRKVDKGFDWSLYKENKYPTDEANGTLVRWKPDDKIFSDTNITYEYLCGVCQDIASNAHINVDVYDEETDKRVTYEASDEEEQLKRLCRYSMDEVDQIFHMHKLLHGTKRLQGEDFLYVDDINIYLALVSENGSTKFNHNMVRVTGGSHTDGLNRGIFDFLSNLANQAGVRLKEKDYLGTYSCVISTKSNDATTLKGQIKDELGDIQIEDGIAELISTRLSTEYAKGNAYVKRYVDMIIQRANNRVLLDNQLKVEREMSKMARSKKPAKFSTCEAYERRLSDAELWLSEGDSAKGAIMSVRDAYWQAALPLRGKCLNCVKASVEDILANEEIKSIFSLIETGMDLGGDISTFDISKLRFDKIIFATDADEDGFQIRVLLFLIFYRLAPQLLLPCGVDEKGRTVSHIYIAETPRFGISLRNGQMLYANTDEERDAIYENYVGQITGTNRYKGLGETSKEVLRTTTVHRDTRNLIPVVMDFEDTSLRDLIDTLFGKDKYRMRKSLLAELIGGDVSDMVDDVTMRLEAIDNSDMGDGISYDDVEVRG